MHGAPVKRGFTELIQALGGKPTEGSIMPDAIGPHLLGRVPSPPDKRDYLMNQLLSKLEAPEPVHPLTVLLDELKASKGAAKSTKVWAEGITDFLVKEFPASAPDTIVYTDVHQLDQGDTGHCVGFGWAQWGNTEPIDDKFANDDGHSIYYECKVIDGEPKAENGSNVRSGATAMKDRSRLRTYAFCANTTDVDDFLFNHGPLVVGSNWYDSMFEPASDGIVQFDINETIAGGHCYLLVGKERMGGQFFYKFQNSWGKSWGLDGYFYIEAWDFDDLIWTTDMNGEVCGAVELEIQL